MATVSARPEALHKFAGMAHDIATDPRTEAGQLRGALDDFRATPGWREFLPEVTPLDVDVVTTAGDASRLAKFVDGGGLGVRARTAISARTGGSRWWKSRRSGRRRWPHPRST